MPKTVIEITALWLRHKKNCVEVLAEVNGKWRLVIQEYIGPIDCTFGHIAEGRGAYNWKEDSPDGD